MNYWLIFLTGLLSGGISCAATQGSLMAVTVANQKGIRKSIWPTMVFFGSKLIAYTVWGGLLGYFGSLFQMSFSAQAVFQLLAGILMFGLAANLLKLHPIFRYFVLTPPAFVYEKLGKIQGNQFFAPLVTGVFTVLIPCGVTLGMHVLAVSSGSPLTGALILFWFILGTAPMFLVVGLLMQYFPRIHKVAAVLVLYFSLVSINNSLVLSGSRYSFDKWVWAFNQSFLTKPSQSASRNITVYVTSQKYTPNQFSVPVGQPVTLNLVTEDNRACTSMFTIPELGINKQLPVTGTTQVTFTALKRGPLTFSCGMGMVVGTIDVI